MENQDYTCSIEVSAPPAEAFNGINNVQGWWAENFEGDSTHPGDTFTVRFGETYGTFRITEMVPNKKVVWYTEDSYLYFLKDKREWVGTSIVFEISPTANGSIVKMTHIGLVPTIECFKDCQKGWNFYIQESLFNLLTKDDGKPGVGIMATVGNGEHIYKGHIYSKSERVRNLPDGYFIVDIKATNVEHVTEAYSVFWFNKNDFDPAKLKGTHYMVIENKPLYEEWDVINDLRAIVQKNFSCSVDVPVPASAAFKGISRVLEWWMSDFKGSATALNDEFTQRHDDTYVNIRLTEFIPDKRMVWLVTDAFLAWQEDKTEWNGTRVVWEISEVDGGSRIHLTHIGLLPGVECYDACEKGWNFHVQQSLYKLLTEGKGLPV